MHWQPQSEPLPQSRHRRVVATSWIPDPTEGTPDWLASDRNPATGCLPPPPLRPDCHFDTLRTVTAESDAGGPCIQP